jgi:hypothetical protein
VHLLAAEWSMSHIRSITSPLRGGERGGITLVCTGCVYQVSPATPDGPTSDRHARREVDGVRVGVHRGDLAGIQGVGVTGVEGASEGVLALRQGAGHVVDSDPPAAVGHQGVVV